MPKMKIKPEDYPDLQLVWHPEKRRKVHAVFSMGEFVGWVRTRHLAENWDDVVETIIDTEPQPRVRHARRGQPKSFTVSHRRLG
jgi:quinolinate synthase